MENTDEVSIYQTRIQFDVVIPEVHVWSFMAKFAYAFAINDAESSHTKNIRAVDGYFNHPAGWHVQVSVMERERDQFLGFLKIFCREKKIFFREPKK